MKLSPLNLLSMQLDGLVHPRALPVNVLARTNHSPHQPYDFSMCPVREVRLIVFSPSLQYVKCTSQYSNGAFWLPVDAVDVVEVLHE